MTVDDQNSKMNCYLVGRYIRPIEAVQNKMSFRSHGESHPGAR